ncbi:unnamed protein product [Mortierella alpina]
MEKVFILPELIFNVGRFLSRHDLSVCLRVSYLFNATLTPLLFQDIHIEVDIRLPRSLRAFPRKQLDTLCRHATDVHHLVLAHSLYREFFHSGHIFRQLKTLKIGRHSYIWEADAFSADDSVQIVHPEEDAQLLGKMISADMCPTLKELSLSELRPVPLHPFWQSLQDSNTIHTFHWLSGPSELRCSYPRWAGEQCANYWLCLPESIPRDKFLAGFRFMNLHHIRLQELVRLTSAEQLRFLCQCPEARTLTWHATTTSSKFPSEEAKVLLQTTVWPHLHSLDLMITRVEDEDLQVILNSIGEVGPEGCLQRLTVPMTVSAIHAGDSLRRHFGSLRSINLQNGLTSAMAQEIMASCPELESITGTCILAEDILKGRPWVCRRLHTFDLCILVASTSALEPPSHQENGQGWGQETASKPQSGIDRVVFERLALLPRLQQLLTDPPKYARPPGFELSGRPLRWNIEAGLDQLAGLTRIRRIHLDRPESHLEISDMAWMLKHWPRLKTIGGLQNHRSNPNLAALIDMMKDHNIVSS